MEYEENDMQAHNYFDRLKQWKISLDSIVQMWNISILFLFHFKSIFIPFPWNPVWMKISIYLINASQNECFHLWTHLTCLKFCFCEALEECEMAVKIRLFVCSFVLFVLLVLLHFYGWLVTKWQPHSKRNNLWIH